jgi:Mandelate racemase / muconate lactonizing enzyme, N-terminal domain
VTGREPRIEKLTAALYEIPTGQPEADGTLAWSKTTIVVAEAAGGGQGGLGYTYVSGACQPLISGVLAGKVTGRPVLDVGSSWQAMVRGGRNLGRPGLVSCAISAVDTALWGLKGKPLGLPVRRLPGAVATRFPSTVATASPPTTLPPPGLSWSCGPASGQSPASRSRSASRGATSVAGPTMSAIKAFGALGGFAGSYVVGALGGGSKSGAAFIFMAAAPFASAVLVLFVRRQAATPPETADRRWPPSPQPAATRSRDGDQG